MRITLNSRGLHIWVINKTSECHLKLPHGKKKKIDVAAVNIGITTRDELAMSIWSFKLVKRNIKLFFLGSRVAF